MTPIQLAWKLAELAEFPPLATRLEQEHWPPTKRVYYTSQREHWLAHLQALQDKGKRDAGAAYNRIQNVPMLIWIAAATGVTADLIEKATAEAVMIEFMRLPGWPQRACNAFRRHIPWEMISKALLTKEQTK